MLNCSSIDSDSIALAAGFYDSFVGSILTEKLLLLPAMPVQVSNCTVHIAGWRQGIRLGKQTTNCAINMFVFFFLCWK
jgi:hypothetical protein